MWIGSHPLFTVRRPIVSPPGYQSPALGESVPTPGLQDHQRVTPYHGVTTSTLSRVPRIFLPVVSQTRTHREDKINTTVSQDASNVTEHLRESIIQAMDIKRTVDVGIKRTFSSRIDEPLAMMSLIVPIPSTVMDEPPTPVTV